MISMIRQHLLKRKSPDCLSNRAPARNHSRRAGSRASRTSGIARQRLRDGRRHMTADGYAGGGRHAKVMPVTSIPRRQRLWKPPRDPAPPDRTRALTLGRDLDIEPRRMKGCGNGTVRGTEPAQNTCLEPRTLSVFAAVVAGAPVP